MVSFKGNKVEGFSLGCLPEGLMWLILTDNQLSALPDDFGRYKQLQKLALSGNRLSSLPESMAQCHNLELIRLSLNQFESFPDWLFALPKLAWLAIGANPATPVHLKSDVTHHSIDQYQLGEQLGMGASGAIYLAHHNDNPAQVAIKLFKGWLTSDGCPKDELANALNAGSHKNLIPILANLTGLELPGMVMALIPQHFASLGLPPSFGTITRDTFTEGFVTTPAQIMQWAIQVTSVMKHLHERVICHGDLYAHNMLVDDSGMLYLGDFGAATALNALPIEQQQHFMKLEVRAFGYWLEDLIQQLDSLHSDNPCSDFLKLINIRNQCLTPALDERPAFAELGFEFE
jgi:hypothetical protein